MFWGQTNTMFLLIILHWVFCDGLLDAKCSEETCACGKPVTITCTLSHPLEKITLKKNKTTLISMNLTNENQAKGAENISINYTKDKVTVTISKFKFSDILKYELFLVTTEWGHETEYIKVNVNGICDPEISENNFTKVFECEAESENNASIFWIDNHRKIYQPTKTWEPIKFNEGFKLRASLKWTEEIGDNPVYCIVSYQEGSRYEEKKSCIPNTSATANKVLGSKSPAIHLAFLLPVALVAALLFFLYKRRNRSIMRARSPSQGPLMGQDAHEEQRTTEQFVQPQSV